MIREMQQSAPLIPDKLFFKIGEVCELVGVQAHVLRYWETEFTMLQPQKNRAGQRTYRRKDVEIALRIKELLYDEGFTIAGAKRKLSSEGRAATSRFQIVPAGASASDLEIASESEDEPPSHSAPSTSPATSRLSRETIKRLRLMAEDLLTTLNRDVT
jgi:DNA-binding transcriptional MerR regulator